MSNDDGNEGWDFVYNGEGNDDNIFPGMSLASRSILPSG
jgi:hypothetical protein